jgi:ribosome-interacting GTPase 1
LETDIRVKGRDYDLDGQAMPTNLPPEAKDKWEEVEATNEPHEKLRLLEEFLSLIPRHHGTSRLIVQTKKRITNLRKEIEERKRKKAARSGPKFFIEKEGAAQIAVIGLTKAGKSSLLAAVTNAKVEVSASPYTTRVPTPGILNYQDVQFQLVEAPALMEGSGDGRAWGLQTLGIARNADGLIIMVDLSQNPADELSLILEEMGKARITVSRPKARVEVDRRYMGAGLRIIVFGRLVNCTFKEVEDLLKSYRITDAFVKISGDATLEAVEEAVFQNMVYKPAIVVANKADLKGAEKNLRPLRTFVHGRFPMLSASCRTRAGLEKLGETLFRTLSLMRIYTKEPNERGFSKKPFVLKKKSSVYDLAKNIHSDFKENFSYARVWSQRLTFSPQKVGAMFILQDGDAVEIHMK